MGLMDRKAGTAGQWDIMKRVLGLSVLVLVTMVGWGIVQHRSDLQKCLSVHSAEAQELHQALLTRLTSLEAQAATHHANLTGYLHDTIDSNNILTDLKELKVQLSAGIEQIQSSGRNVPGQMKMFIDKLQQEVSDKLEQIANSVKTEVEVVKADVQGLKTGFEFGVGSVKTAVDGIKGTVDGMKGSVDGMKGSVDGIKGSVDGMKGTVDGIKGGVDGIKGGVDGMKGGVDGIKGSVDELKGGLDGLQSGLKQQSKTGSTVARAVGACPEVCVDVVFLYHDDDKTMFVDNGVLEAARKHLQGIRKFWVVSKSNSTFMHLVDERTAWFDEAQAPFKKSDWDSRKSGRPTGWLYQQTLKFWLAENLPNSCDNVMFVDSDTLWLRDFNVVTQEKQEDGSCRVKFKYNLSTQKTGAWDGDIVNTEYHHFVKFITGLPKALANTNTAINHWQLMQRDVVKALARSVAARTEFKVVSQAMVYYGLTFNGMSEYEAYFSFAWYFYQDRLDMVHLPFVMRDPKNCNYSNAETTKPFQDKTMIHYFTCHDNYVGGDYYTNCKGREKQCNPYLVESESEE